MVIVNQSFPQKWKTSKENIWSDRWKRKLLTQIEIKNYGRRRMKEVWVVKKRLVARTLWDKRNGKKDLRTSMKKW